MSAQDLLNRWGERKYGKVGTYTLETDVGGYVSDVTDASYSYLRVDCNGRAVGEIEGCDFVALLNEILGDKP